jgi:hypothetical protein
MTTNPDGKPYIHNAEQSEAAKHGRMILPTTQPTHADLAWYERELVLANEHKDDWMALHYAIQSECAKLRAALTAALSVLDEHAEEERKFWGAEDKHGLASEAEKIHDQARAALSSPNVAAEPRAAKTQETPRSSAACAAWESGLGDGPSVSLVFAQRLDCELIALTAERDQLRAELAAEREKAERYRLATLRLDAELAAERARLDSGQILLTVAGERVWHCGEDLRAAIDAGMKEGAK